MDWTILFDKKHQIISEDSKVAYSDILYIPVGKTALLSMYNMINEAYIVKDPETGKPISMDLNPCVVVHKLSLGQTGDVARKIACDEKVNILGELKTLLLERRVFHEPVYQCGEQWILSPCDNFALIPTPGFYMLEMRDLHQFETAYIEYALLSVAESLAIPDDFKMGELLGGEL